MKIRTNKNFGRLTDSELSQFAGRVITNLSGNATYPTPPVPTAQLTILNGSFDNAIIAATNGTPLATSQKNTARAALQDALSKDAAYVDIQCDGNIDLLLSSGYYAVSTNRIQQMLQARRSSRSRPLHKKGS